MILFDGVCNLCNSSVKFVIKHDHAKKFKLGSLQSKEGKEILEQYNINSQSSRTFILIQNGKVYTRSTAALRVLTHLNGLWPALSIFLIVPRFIRDYIYNTISKNRYKWFGRKDQCWIPENSVQDRFIESF